MSLPVEYTTEWIPAWRWFSLNYKKGQLVLSGLTHDYHGYHVEAVANCGMEKYGNLPGFQPHQAPGEDCSCGFHGHATKEGSLTYCGVDYGVFAHVELSGNLIAHGEDAANIEGYRAEKMRVLSLTLPNACEICKQSACGYTTKGGKLVPVCKEHRGTKGLLSAIDIANALHVEVTVDDLASLQATAWHDLATPIVTRLRERVAASGLTLDGLRQQFADDPGSMAGWFFDLAKLHGEADFTWREFFAQEPQLGLAGMRTFDNALRSKTSDGIDEYAQEWNVIYDHYQNLVRLAEHLRTQATDAGLSYDNLEAQLVRDPSSVGPWLAPLCEGPTVDEAWELLTGRELPTLTRRQRQILQHAHKAAHRELDGATKKARRFRPEYLETQDQVTITTIAAWTAAAANFQTAIQQARQSRQQLTQDGISMNELRAQIATRPASAASLLAPLVKLVGDAQIAWELLAGKGSKVPLSGELRFAAEGVARHDDPIWAWQMLLDEEHAITPEEYSQLGRCVLSMTSKAIERSRQALVAYAADMVSDLRTALMGTDTQTASGIVDEYIVRIRNGESRADAEVGAVLGTADLDGLQPHRAAVVRLFRVLGEGHQVALMRGDAPTQQYWFGILKEAKGHLLQSREAA